MVQLLVEMRPKFEEAGHPEWIEEAEKRVAAFPWDIGGGKGAYDPRRFHGRAALAKGDFLAAQGQWGNALNAYHAAIKQLKTLVSEQPQARLFHTELAQARIGEAVALVKLEFHKEAFGAAQKALDLLEPRPGESTTDTVWAAMVDAACALAQTVTSADQRAEDALKILSGMGDRLPRGDTLEQFTVEQAGWHSRVLCERTRLALLLREKDGAKKAKPAAVNAVACARHAAILTNGGELALRQLAVALAAESDVARRLEDSPRMTERLSEATDILLKRLKAPPLSMPETPYEIVAEAWENTAQFQKCVGDVMIRTEYYFAASVSNEQAIKLWERLRARSKTRANMTALSRLSLENVHLLRLAKKDAEAVPWAARVVRQFEISVSGRTYGSALALNTAEAALVMIEQKVPDRGGESPPWKESARAAMQWLRESDASLHLEERQRRDALEKRLVTLSQRDAPTAP